MNGVGLRTGVPGAVPFFSARMSRADSHEPEDDAWLVIWLSQDICGPTTSPTSPREGGGEGRMSGLRLTSRLGEAGVPITCGPWGWGWG